jgi:hypothetical protein
MQILPRPKVSPKIQVLNWIFRPMSYLRECAKKYGEIWEHLKFVRTDELADRGENQRK